MELGAAEVTLSEADLAMIGRATVYEAQAKTCLTLAFKRLTNASHGHWKEKIEKKKFGDLVDDISVEISKFPDLKAHFERIAANHIRWRDGRNLVVHAVWGTGSDGKPTAYCYRRNLLADQNDIVRAMNDCFWLAKEARNFAYQVAIAVSEGIVPPCDNGDGMVHIQVPKGSVTF